MKFVYNILTCLIFCHTSFADTPFVSNNDSKQYNYDKDTVEIYNYVDSVSKYFYLGKFNAAMKCANLVEKKANKLNYKEGLAIAQRWKGSIYKGKAQMDSALLCYNLALKYYDELNNTKGFVKVCNILGDFYYNSTEYEISQEYYLKALAINEKMNDSIGLAISYNNIGRIYYSQENYENALIYYFKAIEIKNLLENKSSLAITYNNIAKTYLKVNSYDSAGYFFDIAKKLFNKSGDLVGEADCLMSMGNLKYESKEYLTSISSLNEAFRVYKIINDSIRIAASQLALGKNYLMLNNFNKAEFFFREVLRISIHFKIKKNLMDVYLYLSHLKNKKAEYKEALEYYKSYTEMKDSIFSEESRNKIIEINKKYESVKKDKAIVELNQEKNRIIAENTLKSLARENKTKFLITVTFLICALILLFYRFSNMKLQKERQKEFTKQLIESQEDERKRISKDLHDGIGQNLLVIKNSCPNEISLIESTIKDLRNISRNMHPVQLEKLGFTKATESIIMEAKHNSKILFTYEMDDVNNYLTPIRQINLFRIIQECISNILKHSETSAAKITIIKNADKIVTSIYDKGKGFDINEARKKKSLGLTSITERVELIDGKLEINSGVHGTRIEIILKYA